MHEPSKPIDLKNRIHSLDLLRGLCFGNSDYEYKLFLKSVKLI